MNLKWLVTQKFRFDIAMTFLALINFGLLVSANSEKLKEWFGIENTITIVFIVSMFCLLLVWFFGLFLDLVKFPHAIFGIEAERNPILSEMLERLKNMEDRIDEKK